MLKPLFSKLPKRALAVFLCKIAFVAVCISAFIFIGNYISRNAEYEYTPMQKTFVTSKEIESTKPLLHTLVLENGNLAICFEDGTKEYVSMNIDALTEYDTRLLEKGICVTDDELLEILESFSS